MTEGVVYTFGGPGELQTSYNLRFFYSFLFMFKVDRRFPLPNLYIYEQLRFLLYVIFNRYFNCLVILLLYTTHFKKCKREGESSKTSSINTTSKGPRVLSYQGHLFPWTTDPGLGEVGIVRCVGIRPVKGRGLLVILTYLYWFLVS